MSNLQCASTWYKVPYLTANHFAECYSGVTYFQNVSQVQTERTYYTRTPDDIRGFSDKSRVRALQRLNMIDVSALHSPHFITLTYHAHFPETSRDIKKDLDNFIKRLRRAYPNIVYFWRVELQRRLAPHFHFIIWFLKNDNDINSAVLYKTIRRLWVPYINCGCQFCFSHSVRIDAIDNIQKATFYVSKYLAKTIPVANEISLGRVWGYSKNMPFRQSLMVFGNADFITVLQFSCILWSLQYTKSNANYLTSLLYRPTMFLFIPDKVVIELKKAIEQGILDPVTFVSRKLKYNRKRHILDLDTSAHILPPQPASCFCCTPQAEANLPVVVSSSAYSAIQIVNDYCTRVHRSKNYTNY